MARLIICGFVCVAMAHAAACSKESDTAERKRAERDPSQDQSAALPPPPVQAACNAAAGGVVQIEGGAFSMGADDAYPEEGKARRVTVKSFWIDRTEVTTAAFAAFVKATGYMTVAERPVDPKLYPGADPRFLKPGGAVFMPSEKADMSDYLSWWAFTPGADFRNPKGPAAPAAADIEPVTQVAYEDAVSFAAWAGGRLPTEAEWEFASRAGAENPADPKVAPTNANTWQGVFPVVNSSADGFSGVAPVGCYAPNGFGLFDMLGNVWEWTSDWYAPQQAVETDNPTGVTEAESLDPNNPGLPSRVIKGGSFLCAPNYCVRYRSSARHAQDAGFGANHIGFRVVYDKAPDWLAQ